MSVRLNVLVKSWIALLKEPEKLAIGESKDCMPG
jgi:hypothetical protein